MTEVRWDILANLGDTIVNTYDARRARQLQELEFAAGGRLADIALQNLGGTPAAAAPVAPIAPAAAPKPPSFAGGGARMVSPEAAVDPVSSNLPVHQRALLNGIAGPESGGRYDIRYTPEGGATFAGFNAHPGMFAPGP